MSSVTLPHVLKFLKSCNPDLISGCSTEARRTLYSLFVAGLEQQRPDLYRTVVVAGEAAASQRQAQQQRLAALFRKGPTAAAPGTSNDADLASAANSSNHSAAQPERFTFGFNL